MDIVDQLKLMLNGRVIVFPNDQTIIAAIQEIERLRNECAHLQFCLNSRDEYLGSIGKWEAYCATLPAGKAGIAGGWADAHEQSASGVNNKPEGVPSKQK